eukprot:365309-Chlamydomonas_euryale.AAC.2
MMSRAVTGPVRMRIGAGPRPCAGPHLAQSEPPQWPRARICGHAPRGPSRGAPPDPRWGNPFPKYKP